METPQMINLQIATFAGLGLPRTFNKPVEASTPTNEVLHTIYNALPNSEIGPRLIVSTTDGRRLSSRSDAPISTFTTDGSRILPLRLSSRLCGGKGGFGSQLRAAGGRMSSRKNRDREKTNGSNRNLDGRRLRTVEEAKRLAQYLEMKPDMERKEKEERKARWESVIKAAEETEAKIKSGKMGSNAGRLNAEYVESKELAEDKMRDAIARAMKDGLFTEKTGSESSVDEEMEDSEEEQEASGSSSTGSNQATTHFFGWDDEDDEDDEDEDDEEDDNEEDEDKNEDQNDEVDDVNTRSTTLHNGQTTAGEQLSEELKDATYTGKGKGKAK